MRGTTTALGALVLAAACGGPDPAATSLALSTGVMLPPPASSDPAAASMTTTTTSGPSSSSGSGPEASSTASTSEGETSGLLVDVGSPDAGDDPLPAGCKGKIDFLFMVSRRITMLPVQERMIAAFPGFIETIESKFADFDYHIMIVDSDSKWGHSTCNKDCSPEACPVEDYPCEMVDSLPACETTIGAGTVFPVGSGASNKLCPMLAGRRYFTREQPDPAGTFACAATVGVSGSDMLGEAVAAAVSPELNGPGGCNEGFLRDDALLMVTFIERGYDLKSTGKPKLWAEALLAAKHGDPGSVVMFSINDPECPPEDRICDLVKYYFPRWYIADHEEPDYGPAFEIATDMVVDACANYIPQ